MKKLAFIGGGNMAEALARGLIAGKVFRPADLIVADVDPARRRKLGRALKIETTADNLQAVRAARAILFAVKPQNIDDVLGEIRAAIALGGKPPARARPAGAPVPIAPQARLFISIAAGVTIARFSAALGADARVIRVMPNAPAMVGQGMAALTRSPGASRADLSFALRIFRAVGDAIALDDEALLDAVTALSGSGPAYVYLFVKALADGGVAEGLEPALATRMALQTLRGAVETMSKSKLDAAELIRIVASPGGTTEAALRKFDEGGFSAIVGDALHAAAQRSRELGRG
ncbi:pyrroline-5-carboxylate reductase [bacterium]|nr:pyrroline-5-carboxylate reductase [bacterium]